MIDNPHQSVYLLAEQYSHFALAEKDDYLTALREIARETGSIYPTDAEKTCIKTIQSLIKKLERKGLAYEITDALRFTLIIKYPDDKETIIACLHKYGYRVWTNPKTGKEDITDRFLDPQPGYKDIAIKLVKSEADHIVKELQLLQSAMYKAKQEKGHDLYDSIKALALQRIEALKWIKAFEQELAEIDEDQYGSSKKLELHKQIEELEQDLTEIDEDKKELESLSDALYQSAFKQDNPAGIGNPNFL